METPDSVSKIYSWQDYFLITTGFLLFFLFLYFIKETLSPVLLVITIFFILLPVIKYNVTKNLLLVILFLFLIWLAYGMVSILQVFGIGIFLAYLLNPLIVKVEKKVRRPIAALIILLVLFSIIALLIVIFSPMLFDSIRKFYTPVSLKNIKNTLTNAIYPYVSQFGLDKGDLRNIWETKVIPGFDHLLSGIFSGVSDIGSILLGFFQHILYIFILPFFTYYVLVDWEKIIQTVINLFPPKSQSKADRYLKKINTILVSYIRGLIVVASLNAIDVTVILLIFGHEYAILVGLLSGLFTFIPQFGVVISMVVGSLIGLLTGRPAFYLPVTIFVLLGHNILEAALINPKLVGKKINVHPALLIVSVFVFAYLFGFIGLFIAAPTTAILISIFNDWREA